MSRRLRSGAERIWSRHDGVAGRQFGRHYRSLVAQLGPFDGLAQAYASGVAWLWVQWSEANEALANARRLRKEGKGRRPSAWRIGHLQRRAGIAWMTYDGARKHLAELTQPRYEQSDLAALLQKEGIP